jgi:23S rRNA (uracil1939-C5)-methyltransferase
MPAPGQLVPLTIEKPAAGGRMIARLDGRVVLVSGAIPGEHVTARIDRVAKNIAYATTATVDEPSPDRRPPFADPLCGGCLFSHIAYPRQLGLKAEIVADAFARIGRLPLSSPVQVAASREDGYRMRARLHVRGRRFGFFREGTHAPCDARKTRQLLPATSDALDRAMAAMASLGVGTIREIELSENVDATERVVHLETAAPTDPRALEKIMAVDGLTPGPYVTDVLAIDDRVLRLRRHVQSFFQGNRYLLKDLVAHVTAQVPVGTPVVDLYAGVGIFSVAAAVLRDAEVVAVEGDRVAAEDLHANAAVSGARLTSTRQAVEDFVRVYRAPRAATADSPAGNTVIVDPPRTGMTGEALDGAVGLGASRLIYVSCDVATLARDARRIVDARYRIDRIDGFDLFPNTPHVETVVVFMKAS